MLKLRVCDGALGKEKSLSKVNGLTRQQILMCIKHEGTLTADQLSQHLEISPVAVRQHLSALEAEGYICVRIERKGLGRPSHRYCLTDTGDETFPRTYDQFAEMLLSELEIWQGSDALPELMRRQRERQLSALLPRISGKPFAAGLKEIARVYTERGFMAESKEVSTDEYLLLKRNCAICSLARHMPELCCGSEEGFLSKLLDGAEVSLEKSFAAGDHCCQFRIRK